MPSALRREKALTCVPELCQSPPAPAPGFPHPTHFGLSALEMTTPSQATYFFLYNEYKPQKWTAKKSRPTYAASCVTSGLWPSLCLRCLICKRDLKQTLCPLLGPQRHYNGMRPMKACRAMPSNVGEPRTLTPATFHLGRRETDLILERERA